MNVEDKIAGTEWLPSDWLDEAVPAPQEVREAFIQPDGEGGWLLRPVDTDEHDEGDVIEVKPGAIVMFSAFRSYGTRTLTISGSEPPYIAPYPADANCFAANFDFETIGDTLEELVATHKADGSLSDGDHTIHIWYWSDRDYPFEFVIDDATGAPRCEAVGRA